MEASMDASTTSATPVEAFTTSTVIRTKQRSLTRTRVRVSDS